MKKDQPASCRRIGRCAPRKVLGSQRRLSSSTKGTLHELAACKVDLLAWHYYKVHCPVQLECSLSGKGVGCHEGREQGGACIGVQQNHWELICRNTVLTVLHNTGGACASCIFDVGRAPTFPRDGCSMPGRPEQPDLLLLPAAARSLDQTPGSILLYYRHCAPRDIWA